MKIRSLLNSQNLLTEEIKNINYHMNLLDCDIEKLKREFPILNDKSKRKLALLVVELFKKCDSASPNYDFKVDVAMTRIGLETDKFYGVHNYNKWNNGMFEDDGFGFGIEVTGSYDDYIDSQTNSRSK